MENKEPLEVQIRYRDFVPTVDFYENLLTGLYCFVESTSDLNRVNLTELSEYLQERPEMTNHIKALLRETKQTTKNLLHLLELIN